MNPAEWTSPAVPRFRLCLVREQEIPYGEFPTMGRPAAVVAWLWQHVFADAPQEVMAALHLDSKHRLIGYNVAFVGGLARMSVEPRGLIVPALLANAAGIILAHNHPSEDPSPSFNDVEMTRRIQAACATVGLDLLDHLVVGTRTGWVSLRERELLRQPE